MGTQILNGVAQAINRVILFIPQLVGFLVVLLIGYFIAKLLAKAVDAILERVGFDRMVERGGIKKMLARSKYDASSLLSAVVYYTVMLFVLQLSFSVFGPNPVSTGLSAVISYLPNVFVAGLIVVIGFAIAAAVREIVDAAIGGLSYGRAVATGVGVAIMVVAVFAALSQLAIAPAIVTGLFYAVLAAVVGIAIVAVGGGGITAMRRYWERALTRVEMEAPAMREQASGANERIKQRADERMGQARSNFPPPRVPAGAR